MNIERQYIGARYVPILGGAWDKNKSYEALTIVQTNNSSYTSKKPVPPGIEIVNTEYWVLTGNFNGQVEEYRQEVEEYRQEVEQLVNKVSKFYENVEDMKRAEINVGTIAITKGFHNAGDGGFGIYILTNDTPNGFDKIQCLNGCANLINDDGNIARYGAKNGGSIDEILDYAKTKNFLKIPIGKYYINKTHTIENVEIVGTDREKTELVVNNGGGNEIIGFKLGIHCSVKNLSVSSAQLGKNTAFETVGSFDWFENVTVKNLFNAFVVKCSNVTLFNVFTYNIFFYCVEINSNDSDVVNTNITSCRFWGHEPGGARGIAVGGSGHATEGLKVANTDIDFCDNGIEISRHFLEFEFVNVVVDQIYKNGIIIANDGAKSEGFSMTNCYVGGYGPVINTEYVGVNIYGAGELSSVKFTNCFFNKGDAATFRELYTSGQDLKAWFISGCTFYAPLSGEPNLILDSINGVLVDKCYFPNSGTNLCVNMANNKGLSGNKGNIDRCVCVDENKILVDSIYTKTNVFTV